MKVFLVSLAVAWTLAGPVRGQEQALARLDPPASAEEKALFEKARAENPALIPQFMATRQYFRQLQAKFKNSQAKPEQSPKPSDNVVFRFALNDKEASDLYKIKLYWYKK